MQQILFQTVKEKEWEKRARKKLANHKYVNINTFDSQKKQEAHGPQRSAEKTSWKSTNIYKYHNVDSEKKGFSFEQTWIPITQGCTVAGLIEIGPVVLEKKIFLISSTYFRCFVIKPPWKRAGPFIWTILSPFHQRIYCARFGWNWSSGSWKDI